MTLAAISLIAVGCKTINDSILFTIKEGRNNTSGRLFPELINSDCINFEFYIHKSWLCDNESNGWNYRDAPMKSADDRKLFYRCCYLLFCPDFKEKSSFCKQIFAQ